MIVTSNDLRSCCFVEYTYFFLCVFNGVYKVPTPDFHVPGYLVLQFPVQCAQNRYVNSECHIAWTN